MRRVRAALVLASLAGPPARAEVPFDAAQMPLPAAEYWALKGPRVVTVEGRALCTAMHLPEAFPCGADTILDAAQQQTDPALWIDKVISGDGAHPGWSECLNPVVLETTPGRDGAPDQVVVGCHVPPGPDAVTPERIDRLLAAVRTLAAIAPKTLAEQEKAARVVEEIEWLDRVTRRP